MSSLFGLDPTHLITVFGYWGIFVIVGLESMGIPMPGETVLVTAAVYAGTTHHLDIIVVIAAAAAGAIVGDNLGFWIGRKLGFPILVRFGPRIGLNVARLKLGQYMFQRHGGKVVFFGRFVAVLRALAAVLAGANHMGWSRFLVFNAAGGIVWASIYGGGAYLVGTAIERVAGPIGIAFAIIVLVGAVIGFFIIRKAEAGLLAKAEEALPGPLEPKAKF